MNTFIEVPANANSIAKRKLVYGVGINDSDYLTNFKEGSKRTMCPYYQKWHSMIQRCYDPLELDKYPTYIDCYVCEEWLYFTKFKSWMETQNWEGLELDKDIKVKGNKLYAHHTCLFISRLLNNLLNVRSSYKDSTHRGVVFQKNINKYQAKIRIQGKSMHIGVYHSICDAREAYIKAKNKEIIRQSDLVENKEIKEYFNQHLLKE